MNFVLWHCSYCIIHSVHIFLVDHKIFFMRYLYLASILVCSLFQLPFFDVFLTSRILPVHHSELWFTKHIKISKTSKQTPRKSRRDIQVCQLIELIADGTVFVVPACPPHDVRMGKYLISGFFNKAVMFAQQFVIPSHL